jgi:ubiquinol-cytochrome c reductase cytochrome b subunit
MTNQIVKLIKKSIKDLPVPSSISTLWNMGFMLGMFITVQIVSGLILAIAYVPNIETVFFTTSIITKERYTIWTTRLIHTNNASILFILIYIHIGRGLYYSSPNTQKEVWSTGMTIMVIIIITAFLGYVLPWGQISFWGATVITGILSSIPIFGQSMVTWIWGGNSISQATLRRFFSLHFLLPIIIILIITIHLMILHKKGSSNTHSIITNKDKVKFNPIFSIKDTLVVIIITLTIIILIMKNPNIIREPENFITANPLMAPLHIQPEWYFLFAYVTLRSIPSKLGGVIIIAISIIILTKPITNKNQSMKFKPTQKIKFWILTATLAILTWIGTKTVEPPFEKIGQVYTLGYFLLILRV